MLAAAARNSINNCFSTSENISYSASLPLAPSNLAMQCLDSRRPLILMLIEPCIHPITISFASDRSAAGSPVQALNTIPPPPLFYIRWLSAYPSSIRTHHKTTTFHAHLSQHVAHHSPTTNTIHICQLWFGIRLQQMQIV